MVEQFRNPKLAAELLGQVERAKGLPVERAFVVCQRIAPSETEDARLLIANFSGNLDGYWDQAYGLFGPDKLITRASELNMSNQTIEEIRRTYYGSENPERRELFGQVYKIVRRYMREIQRSPKL